MDLELLRRWCQFAIRFIKERLFNSVSLGPKFDDAIPDITDDVRILSAGPAACGGCADIYRGKWTVVYAGRDGVKGTLTIPVRPFLLVRSRSPRLILILPRLPSKCSVVIRIPNILTMLPRLTIR